jgi:excisionase family DNA binding protein
MSRSSLFTSESVSSPLSGWPFDRPVTKKEAAETLSCTERFLEEEIARGHLRAAKLGLRAVRLLPCDVLQWLNAHPIGK